MPILYKIDGTIEKRKKDKKERFKSNTPEMEWHILKETVNWYCEKQ